MRNLKALFNRVGSGGAVHGYQVIIQTEILTNAHNKIEAKNNVSDIRELIADLVRRNELVGREIDVKVKSL